MGLAVTTSDWALIISLCSFAVALGSFIWNVWSKFIYPMPRVRVSFQAVQIFHPGQPDHERKLITLSTTNFGPGEVMVTAAVIRTRRKGWWKDWRAYFRRRYRFDYGLINPLHDVPNRFNHSMGPFSGGLPKTLKVGENFTLYFPREVDWFENDVRGVGVNDSFNRNHWCDREDVAKVREAVLVASAKSPEAY